ncbi:MAG: 5'-3' exonuclease H3TH domain-containing protein [Pirellulales bacterium]
MSGDVQGNLFGSDDSVKPAKKAARKSAGSRRTNSAPTPTDADPFAESTQAPTSLSTEAALGIPGETASMEPLEPTPLGKSRVWAIDAMSLIFQVFHAVPEMTSPAGEPVNAVFGFTRDIFTILEQKKPDYLFVAYDLDGPTFRHELYENYKGQRSEMPADLIPQIAMIRRVLRALDVPILELPGYEADDLLATLACHVDRAGGECVLVTADKDYRQLISDRVKLYNMRKGQLMDAAALYDDWGIRPDQVVDYQTLVGDPVDNVPGVPLIGPKIAKELLQKFDTLENVYANLDQLGTGKRKQNLENSRETTELAQARQVGMRLAGRDSLDPRFLRWF